MLNDNLNIPIFPTEALILGECLGESIESGDRFLDCFRRRWLPVMPSFIEHKQVEGLGSIKDDSRKSLIDIVLEQLKPSLAQTEFEKKLWHLPKFSHLCHYLENLSELATTYEDRKKIESLLQTDKSDNQEELRTYLSEVSRHSDFSDLFELGQLFGKVIAECEWAIDVLARPDYYKLGDSDDGFTLARYVTAGHVETLSSQIQGQFPGLTFTLLQSAGEALDLEFPYDEDEWDEMAARALKHANAVLSALWTSVGEILGLVRERDVIARIDNEKSPIPREYGINPTSDLSVIEECLIRAEHELNRTEGGRFSPLHAIKEVKDTIEPICARVWPRNTWPVYNGERRFGSQLFEKLKSKNAAEARFASTATTLYRSYRNVVSHNMEELKCTNAEARYFVAGIRCLLELAKHLSADSTS